MSRLFGNPVPGTIKPLGSASDPPTFRVTQSFANPSGPNGSAHGALDLGNGQTGDNVLAIDDGTVYQAFFDGNSGGAGIVRIDHGGGWTSGYAHMNVLKCSVGQKVKKGATIAKLDNTGWSSGAHLHFDITDGNKRVDPWPHLEQNAEDEGVGDVAVKEEKWLNAVHNRRWHAKKGGAKLRDWQGPDGKVLRTMDPGKPFEPTAKVIGGDYNGSNRWYLGWKQFGAEWKTCAVSITELENEEPIEDEAPPGV